MPTSINRRGFLGASLAASSAVASTAANTAAQAGSSGKAWEGIFVIMQTPFLETLEIDEDSLRRETDFLARGRLHGVVWPAGAGETKSIWHKERLKFSEAIVKEARGRTTVLIGVHGANKFEAMEYARYAEKIGADGIHALGPGDDSSDPEILTDYFTAIASVSKLPLSIQVSTPGMTTDLLLKLADKLPTVRILKLEGSNPPHDISKVVRERKRIVHASTGGGAVNLMTEMERGSGGTMAGAGFADIQAEIWDLFHAGKKQEAEALFLKFLLPGVMERRTGYVLQKEVLRRRGIFKTVTMRNTRKFSMDEADLRELDHIMEILKPHFRV
jgi:dihydrodipicolinate synthase/N-acetylneuraminate lyase